ncbi:uncharacterized protein LOC132549249 [Ylistrum balloti]|uniref:uncharacterized protein LOC132549249 n=1 Tax=Ylistrum balloti TaxID=509963 RepID=UPI002905D933|nr:uncharacterized protein LOC132549249 [Ylistrum balloti]
MLSGSFACGEMSTLMADVFNVLQDSVCHKPRTPEILSLLQCMNNRELQVTIFGEIQRLSGIATAYHEIGIPIEKQKSSLCRWQFSSFNGLMQHTRSICDGNVYETICDIRSRLDPYMDAMLAATTNDVECPKETFRCAA